MVMGINTAMVHTIAIIKKHNLFLFADEVYREFAYDGHTHYFNASVLNERYSYSHLPWNIDWDPITNEINFI